MQDRYRHICQVIPMDYIDENRSKYDIALRIVRLEISPGCFENIMTSLLEHEFDFEDVFHADHKFLPIFDKVGKDVPAFIPTIGNENGGEAMVTAGHMVQGKAFMEFFLSLDVDIDVDMVVR